MIYAFYGFTIMGIEGAVGTVLAQALGFYMVCYSILQFGGFLSKPWLEVTVERVTL